MTLDARIDREAVPTRSPSRRACCPTCSSAARSSQTRTRRAGCPRAEGVRFRPLLLSVPGGYYVNMLRVRKAGILSRHRHSGPVHAFTLRASWRDPEHELTAREGD